ncbi:hypothetical protein [Porticoccus sp.]|uniref:hypothetical protein n=1 Tax=Porticoccus sp. TaxID=2024853 RepID=UPI003F695C07
MKIFATCMECFKELGHPSFEPIIADYYDEPVAYIECSKGHKSAFMLQSQKFEILLESAANALLEGYTLEAASTFSAAYERFFEFSIRVICSKNNLEAKELASTFSQVSRQSERQLGAFLFLHLLEFGDTYLVNDKIVSFRNKVIHKGYIPTPDEVEDFAEKIYQEIYSITQKLKINCSQDIQKVIMSSLSERSKKIPNDMPRATSTGAMLFSLSHAEQKPTFSEAMSFYKEAQEKLLGSVPYMKVLSKAAGLLR